MTRFLLVGAGRIGKIHAENIVRSGRGSLAYVTDSNPAAAKQLVTEDPAVTEVLLALALWTVANDSGY